MTEQNPQFIYSPSSNTVLDDTQAGEKTHRTALFFDLTAVNHPKYLNDRVRRLLESMNPPGLGMMIDAYGVDGKKIIRIPTGVVNIISEVADDCISDEAIPVSELNQWAAEKGYQMVLFALPAGYEVS